MNDSDVRKTTTNSRGGVKRQLWISPRGKLWKNSAESIEKYIEFFFLVKDCPLIAQNDQYCIRNHNGIVPTVLDKDMWITFNRSVAKTCLSVYDFKPEMLLNNKNGKQVT
uniref:Uncharacterized protein n=1 Tax=Romanomermis culicivorax TaxID=13658 RepID=A0A915JG31_ROMCU